MTIDEPSRGLFSSAVAGRLFRAAVAGVVGMVAVSAWNRLEARIRDRGSNSSGREVAVGLLSHAVRAIATGLTYRALRPR